MKNSIAAVLAACAAFVQARETIIPDAFSAGEKILFVGDSITHGGRQNDMNHYMGHGYAAEIAMRYLGYAPEKNLLFMNRGISGNTSADLLARWDRDILAATATERGWQNAFKGSGRAFKPDVVSILVGINDYLHPDGKRRVAAEDYAKNIEELVVRTKRSLPDSSIVLCEPFRLPEDKSDDFIARQRAVRETARRHGLCLVEFQQLFSDVLMRDKPDAGYWFWDDFHPTYAAHTRMADFWLETFAAFKAAHGGNVSKGVSND
ncbi:MAG: lysophospholipase [Kiritimatiellae bacterium]|nr:lysophospholipase [Kiritimatiellia bacterium]